MPAQQTQQQRPISVYAAAAVALLIVLAFLALSFFSRPAIDEFQYVAQARDRGFMENQLHWWSQWSGRYSATGAMDLFFSAFDLVRHHFLVGLITLGLLWLSSFVVLRAGLGDRLTRWECFWGVTALLAVYLSTMPTAAEAFYWAAGAWTYTSGIIAAMLLVAMLLKWGPHAGGFAAIVLHVAVLLLAFVLAGFNELVMLAMDGLLLVAAVVLFRAGDRAWQFWLTAMIGCWIGSGLMIAAPGHELRQEIFAGWGNDVEDPGRTIVRSVLGAFYILGRGWQLPMIVAILLVQDYVYRLRGWRFLTLGPLANVWFVAGGYLLLIIGLVAPSWWAMGAPPPARAINVIHLALILGSLHLAVLVGLQLQDAARDTPLYSAKVRAVLLLALVVGLLGAKNTEYALFYDLWTKGPAYASLLDARFEMLDEMQAQGVKHAVVPPLPEGAKPKLLFVDDLTGEPGNWRNQGMTLYYGFETLRTGHVK